RIGGERLEPLDNAGDPIDYEFVVRACNDVYCGPRSDPSTERSWLPEMPGFPAVVPDVITTAPLVITINGRDAVFVAGRSIWAWWLDDGTPVNLGTPCTYEFPEHPYGLFYWPPASTEEEDYLESRATFAETLVQLDLPGGGVAVVGSVEGECVHAIKIEPGLYGSYCPVPIWKRCIRAGKTAPTVARMDPGPSITVDPVVLVPGSADTLYAFAATDGSGWIEGLTPDGAFAVNDAPNNVG